MKKISKLVILGLFIIFSFYYTDRVVNLIKNRNPIMKSIKEVASDKSIECVNSIIRNDYIIPGINGLEIDIDRSYNNMLTINSFNEAYLIYKEINPEISINDNKDKIIISGNTLIKRVSLIFEFKEDFIDYIVSNKLMVNMISNLDAVVNNDYIELLNNEMEEDNFIKLNVILDKYNINSNICLVSKNIDICKENGNYLVKETMTLNNSNIIDVKNTIDNGVIIKISANTNIENVKVLINYIKSKGFDIVHLSTLISENR